MAKYNNMTITEAGEKYIADCLYNGKPMRPVYIAIGDGVLTDGTEKQRTALVHEVSRRNIQAGDVVDDYYYFLGEIYTSALQQDIYHRETGLLLADGTLIAYGNAGEDYYDYIPAPGSSTELTKKIRVRLHVGSGLEVKYTFPDTSDFVTYAALKEKMDDLVEEVVTPYAQQAKDEAVEAAVEAAGQNADSSAGNALYGFTESMTDADKAVSLTLWSAWEIQGDAVPGKGAVINRITANKIPTGAEGGLSCDHWLVACSYDPATGTRTKLAVSDAGKNFQPGDTSITWDFASGFRVPTGLSLLLFLVKTPDQDCSTGSSYTADRLPSAAHASGICSYFNSRWEPGFTPYLTFTGYGYLANSEAVTADEKAAWNAHISDSDIHITADERTKWDEHISDTDKHLDSEQQAGLENLLGTAHSLLDATASKGEGEWNGWQIAASLLPAAVLNAITVPTMLNNQTSALWLGVYAYDTATDKMTRLAVSDAGITWASGEKATWTFSGGFTPTAGKDLRLLLVSSASGAGESSASVISSHVKSYYIASGSCKCRYAGLWYGSRTPDIVLHEQAHVDDETRHITAAERESWNMTTLANAYKRWSDTALDASSITQDMLDSIINGREAFQRCGLSETNLLPMQEGGDGATDTRIRLRSMMNAICLFFNNASFNQPVSFDCANTARQAFGGCTSFNSAVYAPAVVDAQYMFHGCTSLNKEVTYTRLVMDAGDTIVLDSAQFCMYTFAGCRAFNQPVNMPSATNCDAMLISCTSMNSKISLPNAVIVHDLLAECPNYNQPVYLPSAVDCYSMLKNCPAFNNPVILPSASDCTYMLQGCTAMSVANIVKTMESLPTWNDGRVHTLGLPTTCADGTTENVLTAEQKAIATNKGWTLEYT